MLSKELFNRVLRGDERAVAELFEVLIPLFQREASRALYRRAQFGAGRPVRQELEDLVQEIFSELLRYRQRVLGGWDPTKGRSAESYLAVFARFTCSGILRGNRSPWVDLPTGAESLEFMSGGDGNPQPDEEVVSSDALAKLYARMQQELSESDFDLVKRLYLEEQTTLEICEALQISAQTLHQRKSRLRVRLLKLAEELKL